MKTIGVALAAYNGAAYLPALLDSLRRQSDPDFTVLWQDDGSSDGTAELLRDVSDKDSRFVPGAEQGLRLGAKGNFLSLMRQLDTPLTALCDQDDVWHADWLAAGRAALEAAEDGTGAPLLAHGDCRLIDASGQVLAPSFFRHQGWSPAAVSLAPLLVQNNVTGCTVTMNAALRRLVCAHADPGRIFMHDWFLAQTAAAFGRVVFIRGALVDYRQHSGNAIGASAGGMLTRAAGALRNRDRIRERMALNYRQAQVLLDAYGDGLPAEAAACVRAFLATQRMPKARRVLALRKGGYRMQSVPARVGQFLFG